MRILNSRKGFTLIELLVVIAIIGILSSFMVANYIGVQQRARDGQRKSDLRSIQTALEVYRSDQDTYPSSPDLDLSSCGSSTFQVGSSVYIQRIPCDPLNDGSFIYTYSPSGGGYTLKACLENSNDSQKDIPNDDAKCLPGSNSVSYTLTNP